MKWYFGKRALSVDYRDDYGRLLDPNLGAPANVNFGADEIGGEGLTVTPIKYRGPVVRRGRDRAGRQGAGQAARRRTSTASCG